LALDGSELSDLGHCCSIPRVAAHDTDENGCCYSWSGSYEGKKNMLHLPGIADILKDVIVQIVNFILVSRWWIAVNEKSHLHRKEQSPLPRELSALAVAILNP
jgi:hypothetical protein